MEYRTDIKGIKKKPVFEVVPVNKKKEFKQPFKPASLKKCEPFNNDNQVFGEEKERLKTFKEISKKERSSPKGKFKLPKLPGSATHDYAFMPPIGFKIVIYTCFIKFLKG